MTSVFILTTSGRDFIRFVHTPVSTGVFSLAFDVADRLGQRRRRVQFRLDTFTLAPAVEPQDHDLLAIRQMLAVVRFPKRPTAREAVGGEGMAKNDWREHRESLADQFRGRPASGAEPLIAESGIGVPVRTRQIDHGATSSAAIRSAFLPVKFS